MARYAPDDQLFYNDYSECVPDKRERIIAPVRNLKEKGCRADGIGMQQHPLLFDENGQAKPFLHRLSADAE